MARHPYGAALAGLPRVRIESDDVCGGGGHADSDLRLGGHRGVGLETDGSFELEIGSGGELGRNKGCGLCGRALERHGGAGRRGLDLRPLEVERAVGDVGVVVLHDELDGRAAALVCCEGGDGGGGLGDGAGWVIWAARPGWGWRGRAGEW